MSKSAVVPISMSSSYETNNLNSQPEKHDLQQEFENAIKKLYFDFSNNYANGKVNTVVNTQKKDTLLPYELNNPKELSRHILSNGPYSMVINGRDVNITYSVFSKGFYITNTNHIIIGEPLYYADMSMNLNEVISDWKLSNKLLTKHEKTFSF